MNVETFGQMVPMRPLPPRPGGQPETLLDFLHVLDGIPPEDPLAGGQIMPTGLVVDCAEAATEGGEPVHDDTLARQEFPDDPAPEGFAPTPNPAASIGIWHADAETAPTARVDDARAGVDGGMVISDEPTAPAQPWHPTRRAPSDAFQEGTGTSLAEPKPLSSRMTADRAQSIGPQPGDAAMPQLPPSALAQGLLDARTLPAPLPEMHLTPQVQDPQATRTPLREAAPPVSTPSPSFRPDGPVMATRNTAAIEPAAPNIVADEPTPESKNTPGVQTTFGLTGLTGHAAEPAQRGPVAPPPERQIAEALTRLPSGTIELRLDPEELGKVRLSLTPDGDRMRLVVLAERPETLDLLRRHSPDLAKEMRALGFDTTEFQFGKDGDGRRNNPFSTSHRGGVVVPQGEDPPLFTLQGSNRLDLRF